MSCSGRPHSDGLGLWGSRRGLETPTASSRPGIDVHYGHVRTDLAVRSSLIYGQRMTGVCISGAPADDDGVCTEHGETACVIGVAPTVAEFEPVEDQPVLTASALTP